MTEVRQQLLVARPQAVLFALVDLCEDYPHFLPWCAAATVHARSESRTDATLSLNFHGVKASFRTLNEKCVPSEIAIKLQEGPFRFLQGRWRFTALGDIGCRVEFELSYAFTNRLLEKAIGPVFHRITQTLVHAFVARAEALTEAEQRALCARVPGLTPG